MPCRYEIDDHVGITIAGLTADARTLSRFMQTECMNHKYAYDVPLPVSRLVTEVGNSESLVADVIPPPPNGYLFPQCRTPFRPDSNNNHFAVEWLLTDRISVSLGRAATEHHWVRPPAVWRRDSCRWI